MRTFRMLGPGLALAASLLGAPGPAGAADPGVIPPSGETGDQRPGSVLFYNLYTSGADPAAHDTRITLTNGNPAPAIVRLFLVEGATRSVTTGFLCLTGFQTASVNASALRAGSTGYLIAVAVDGAGCPVPYNHLTGQAHVRFPSGFRGTLDAIGIPSQGGAPTCNGVATLAFSNTGDGYGRVPRVLALPSIGSRADHFLTLLVVNRVGGSLSTQASGIGDLSGVLYDDAENAFLFNAGSGAAQLVSELSDAFPVTAPPFETVIGEGRTGWARFLNRTTEAGYFGAALVFRGQSAEPAPAPDNGGIAARTPAAGEAVVAEFSGASNLRILELTGTPSYTMPAVPVAC